MDDRINMSISVDSRLDETVNRGTLALLLRWQYEYPFGINRVHFSFFIAAIIYALSVCLFVCLFVCVPCPQLELYKLIFNIFFLMKDYADSSILPKKVDSTGNCLAEKVEKSDLGVARYAATYPPSDSTCS